MILAVFLLLYKTPASSAATLLIEISWETMPHQSRKTEAHEVEDVRVCLFHFIEEDQAVGFPSNLG